MVAVVTGDNRWGGQRGVLEGNRRRNCVQIAINETYPVGGVLLPPIGRFGLVRFLERLQMESPNPSDGFVYKWDSVAGSIRIWEAGVEAAGAVTATIYGTAVGW